VRMVRKSTQKRDDFKEEGMLENDAQVSYLIIEMRG
jgi:hypothetical protein